jgi:hypothetical protein
MVESFVGCYINIDAHVVLRERPKHKQVVGRDLFANAHWLSEREMELLNE